MKPESREPRAEGRAPVASSLDVRRSTLSVESSVKLSLAALPAHAGPRVLVCLHRAPGLISTLIRWQTRSPWSHASLLFPGAGVIEAREFAGVRALPALDPKPGESIEVFAVRGLTPAQECAVFDFAQRQLGKPYDYTMVARFVSRRQESRPSSGKWFCSELCYAALLHAGVPLLRCTEPWEVSPGLLARSPLLVPQPDFFRP